MKSFIKAGQRGLMVAVAAVVAMGFTFPAIAAAAQVTNRSIQPSSSSVSATGVTYQVSFSVPNAAGAFVVDFCSNTPLVGQSCTAPAGFSALGAASSTDGYTVTGAASTVTVVGSVSDSVETSVAISGITNPSTAGPLYARIVTYDNSTNAGNYTATSLGAGAQDSGGVAMLITPTIGVSGTVLETLTFCVSGTDITANCASTTAPVVPLGEEVAAGVIALVPGTISTGSIYTQISTNAVSGAVIRLKSSALNCGGLMRAGAPTACDILPALSGGISAEADEAKFGVKTSDASNPSGVTGKGSLVPVVGSGYNNSTYALNYASGNATGVTSTFGDPFLDTAGAPVNNKNMQLTFGATVANNTPAGSYSADLSLIASGKF